VLQNILDTSETEWVFTGVKLVQNHEMELKKGFTVAEIINIAEKIEMISDMLAALEIAVSDFRC
jgi:hypothetical protein